MIKTQLLREQSTRADQPTKEDFDKLTKAGNRRTMRRQVKRGTSGDVLWALYDDMMAVEAEGGAGLMEPEEDDPPPTGGEDDAEDEEKVEWDGKTYVSDDDGELEIGERGPKVKELQLAIGTPDDGYFGPNTAKALGKATGIGGNLLKISKKGAEDLIAKSKATGGGQSSSTPDDDDTGTPEGPAEAVDVDDIAPIIDKLASIAYMDSSYKESINTPDDDQKKEWHKFAVNNIEESVSPDHARSRVKGDMSSQLTPAAHEKWSQLADELMDVIGDRLPVDMGDFDYSRTFNVEGGPDTQAESFSRAKLRSMILREILRRR